LWDGSAFTSIQDRVSAAGVSCHSAFSDRHGGVWFGFADGGLLRIIDNRIHYFSEAEGLGAEAIHSIYEDSRGTVWVASINRLGRVVGDRITTIGREHGLPSGISAILEDGSDHLWLGVHVGIIR